MKSLDIVRRSCALLLGLVPAVPLAAQEWSHLQGGIYEGAFFFADGRGWLAGDSRIHISEDYGYTWEEAVIDETNGDVRVPLRGMFIIEEDTEVRGWAVGDDGLVLKTVDQTDGHTWEVANQNSRALDACGEPAILYNIFMIENTDYEIGWAVGENGAICRTDDGGETWTNVIEDENDGIEVHPLFSCESPVEIIDAYAIHFFSDPQSQEPFSKGIIAAEYRFVFTTIDGGESWSVIDIAVDAGNPCPDLVIGDPDGQGHLGDNVELWAMSFEDPTDPASDGWVVGGIGFNRGYMYRTSGLANDSWANTWEQRKCYDFIQPIQQTTFNICGPSTQYGVAVLDPSTTPKRVASGGYSSNLFVNAFGTANLNPCTCLDEGEMLCVEDTASWVQLHTVLPQVGVCTGDPVFNTVARTSSTTLCSAGNHGRIVVHNVDTDTFTDVGTEITGRLNSGAFINSSTGSVFGQGPGLFYTENGGVSWAAVTATWDCTGLEGNAIAFSSDGTHGVAVGDGGFVARTDNDLAPQEPWTAWTDDAEDVSVPAAPDLHSVAFVPGEETVFAVGSSGWVLKSEDNGESWVRLTHYPGTGDVHGVSFATPSVGYVAGENLKIYKTVNGGNTWTAPGVGGDGETIFDVETWGDGSEGIAVGQNGGVWVKTSEQPRWVQLDAEDFGFEVTEHLFDVEVLDSGDHVRICGAGGIMLFRDDGDWTNVRSHTALDLERVDFVSAEEGYAFGGLFVVLKYDDP